MSADLEKLKEEYFASRMLSPEIGKCDNFIDKLGEEETVSNVIVPFRISKREDKIIIAWACNHGDDCYRSSCLYAKGGEK